MYYIKKSYIRTVLVCINVWMDVHIIHQNIQHIHQYICIYTTGAKSILENMFFLHYHYDLWNVAEKYGSMKMNK